MPANPYAPSARSRVQGAANYTSMLEHRSTLRCFAFGGLCAAGGYALANLLPRGQGATPADNTLQASAPTSIHLRTRHLTGPVFIVGSGHCGTTLMCRLIDAHRDICCGPESEVFVRNPNRSVDHLLLTTKAYEATANSLVPLSVSSIATALHASQLRHGGRRRRQRMCIISR